MTFLKLAIVLVFFGAPLFVELHPTAPRSHCLALTITTPQVKRVIDGDTYALYDIGITDEERIRVLGVDTPERNEPLYLVARDSTAAWLRRGPFQIAACHRDSFGRLLAWTTRGTDSLHVFLVNLGLGKRMP